MAYNERAKDNRIATKVNAYFLIVPIMQFYSEGGTNFVCDFEPYWFIVLIFDYESIIILFKE